MVFRGRAIERQAATSKVLSPDPGLESGGRPLVHPAHGYLTYIRQTKVAGHPIPLYAEVIDTDELYSMCPMCLRHEREKMMKYSKHLELAKTPNI